jgi:excinuclease UvrABC ATPase subunit
MSERSIEIVNARMNNLKSVSLSIPKGLIVAFTGVSGSGKSSLLFDTIYTEAQRQLVETFSTFARNRLPKLSRPDVDGISNLSTAILIDQKRMGSNLRSTVGTATEVVSYLRLLFSRLADPFVGPSFYYSFNHPEGMCPRCHGLGSRIEVDVGRLVRPELSLREGAIDHPECRVGGFLWREILCLDFFDPDKKLRDFDEEELRILLHTEPIPVSKRHGAGTYLKNWEGLARRFERLRTAKGEAEEGEGGKDAYDEYFTYAPCDECRGTRLNARALSTKIGGWDIGQLCSMEIRDLIPILESRREPAAVPILRKALVLLKAMDEIGIGYLSLERPVSTLSGGECQRVKTARQLDCDLTGLMYILDEPSAGLHPRDAERLSGLLRTLRDAGNSVFVVEHDPEIIGAADWVVDIGPAAGNRGGEIVYNGVGSGLAACGSITALSLAADRRVEPSARARGLSNGDFLRVKDACAHNLKNVSARIPRGLFTCVTGAAGSGKSTLVRECFMREHPEAVLIDQSPIGRTSRGNLVTYTGVFDAIRKIFAASTGRDASLFSFNSRGACPKCGGQGFLAMELFFLDSVRTVCDECEGKRYSREVLALSHKGKNIDELLSMTAAEALAFFDNRRIQAQMELLVEVGLDYVKLGQSLSSLSGGESQRLKIASELAKSGNVYVMDEPTTGLHLSDMEKLYGIVRRLTGAGNTVIVIEHNPDLIKYADWIVDLGPEGGKDGGRLLFEGEPALFPGCERSITARYVEKLWK